MVFGDGSSMYVLCTDDVNDRNHPDEDDNTFSLTRNTEEEKKRKSTQNDRLTSLCVTRSVMYCEILDRFIQRKSCIVSCLAMNSNQIITVDYTTTTQHNVALYVYL